MLTPVDARRATHDAFARKGLPRCRQTPRQSGHRLANVGLCSLPHRLAGGGMRTSPTHALRHPAPLQGHNPDHDQARTSAPRRRRGACGVILQRLRQATADAHAAIESHSVLLDPGLSRVTYRACLRRLFGYYAPLEGRMLRSQAWHRAGLAYGDRHKTPQLAQDLAALGVTPEELAQAPLCHGLPDLRTTARLFGCLFAIDGGTLGGPFVTRHLPARLAVTPQSGGGFLGGCADPTGLRRQAFDMHLTAFARASDADDEIVAGANATFETLDRWLFPARPRDTPAQPAR